MAKYVLIAATLVASSLAIALPEDRDQPIEINADSALINEKENRAQYQGAVEVTQGTFRLNGDQIDLATNANNEVERFVAIGQPARFQSLRRKTDTAPVTGRANRISYSYDDERVVLIGDAEVRSEGSVFSGPEITYDLESGEVTAAGSRSDRVNMTMQPKKQ